MTVHDKISEAEYFLSKLSLVPIEYLRFETSAFLTSARSILDHLLEGVKTYKTPPFVRFRPNTHLTFLYFHKSDHKLTKTDIIQLQ